MGLDGCFSAFKYTIKLSSSLYLLRPSGITFPPLRYFLGLASKPVQASLPQTGHDLTISFDCLKPWIILMSRQLFFVNESLFYYFVDLSKIRLALLKNSSFSISRAPTGKVLKVQAALLTKRQWSTNKNGWRKIKFITRLCHVAQSPSLSYRCLISLAILSNFDNTSN